MTKHGTGAGEERPEERIMRRISGACGLGALTGVLLVACAPAPETATAAREAEMKPRGAATLR